MTKTANQDAQMRYFSVNYIHPTHGYSCFVAMDADQVGNENDVYDYVLDNDLMDETDLSVAHIEEIEEQEYKLATK